MPSWISASRSSTRPSPNRSGSPATSWRHVGGGRSRLAHVTARQTLRRRARRGRRGCRASPGRRHRRARRWPRDRGARWSAGCPTRAVRSARRAVRPGRRDRRRSRSTTPPGALGLHGVDLAVHPEARRGVLDAVAATDPGVDLVRRAVEELHHHSASRPSSSTGPRPGRRRRHVALDHQGLGHRRATASSSA